MSSEDNIFCQNPSASTQQGHDGLYGLDVFTLCKDELQNIAGGRQLSSLYSRASKALPAGTTFVVRVTNLDCKIIASANFGSVPSFSARTLTERQIRQGNSESIGSQNFEGGPILRRELATTSYSALNGDPSDYALIAFGDLDPGKCVKRQQISQVSSRLI